jgi:hypothetical protein
MLGHRSNDNQEKETAEQKQQLVNPRELPTWNNYLANQDLFSRLLYKDRTHESLPWVASPLQALRGKEFKSFHVRHEASLVELFFDLFFVANLATFTAKHEITSSHTITAYMGL